MNDSAVTLHRYRLLDPQTGDWIVQLSKSTEDQIKAIGGQIIAGTAEQVPPVGAAAPGNYGTVIAAAEVDRRDFRSAPARREENLTENPAPRDRMSQHANEPARVGTTEQLKQSAISIFNQMRDRKTKLQSEYDDLQSKLAYKRVELDSQVDILSSSYERMLNFRPALGAKLLCPRCWVVNGKESVAMEHGDVVRCSVCHQGYSVI